MYHIMLLIALNAAPTPEREATHASTKPAKPVTAQHFTTELVCAKRPLTARAASQTTKAKSAVGYGDVEVCEVRIVAVDG